MVHWRLALEIAAALATYRIGATSVANAVQTHEPQPMNLTKVQPRAHCAGVDGNSSEFPEFNVCNDWRLMAFCRGFASGFGNACSWKSGCVDAKLYQPDNRDKLAIVNSYCTVEHREPSQWQQYMPRVRGLLSESKCKRDGSVWMVLMVKDQTEEAIDFVAHHLLLGVSKVLVYSANSRDNLPVAMAPLIDEGLVELTEWGQSKNQTRLYSEASKVAASRGVSWVGFLDTDERLWRDNEQCLPDLLRSANSSVSQMSFNWRIQPITAATVRADKMHQKLEAPIEVRYGSKNCDWSLGVMNRHLKSFVRPSLVNGFTDPHFAWMKNGIQVRPDMTEVRRHLHTRRPGGHFATPDPTHHWLVLHYSAKPLEEMVQKFARGTGDRSNGWSYFSDGDVQDWVEMSLSKFDARAVERFNVSMTRLHQEAQTGPTGPTIGPDCVGFVPEPPRMLSHAEKKRLRNARRGK